MKANIWSFGDDEVGIAGFEATIEVDFDTRDEDERTQVRIACENFAKELDACGTICVVFDDECSECGLILNNDKKCPNKDCISNEHLEDENYGEKP